MKSKDSGAKPLSPGGEFIPCSNVPAIRRSAAQPGLGFAVQAPPPARRRMGRTRHMSDLFFSRDEIVADRSRRHTKFGGYGITRHAVAKWLYWSRTVRPDDGIKKLYGEAVWDIFLDLYIAEAEAKRISVTSMCIGSGVAPTTALRYMTILIDAGWLVREEDEIDNRRIFVKLSGSAKAQMDLYLDTVMERLWSLLPAALVESAESEVSQLRTIIQELLEELRLARRERNG